MFSSLICVFVICLKKTLETFKVAANQNFGREKTIISFSGLLSCALTLSRPNMEFSVLRNLPDLYTTYFSVAMV